MNNYHCHKSESNIMTPDSAVKIRDYAKRAVELGDKILSSLEHGFQGNYFETYRVAKEYGLKFIYGAEAYWVKDRFEKDRTNSHICIFAKTDKGRKALNLALSEANISGFYHRPRLDLDLIMSLPEKDVFITSACVAFWKYDDIEDIIVKIYQKFKSNFMLEIQYHNTDLQKEINSKLLDIANKYGIEIILGMDSHYINESQHQDREEVLLSKNVHYDDEDGWFMDYPNNNEAINRLRIQGILSEEQIENAINNTKIFETFDDFDNIDIFSNRIKLPTLYPSLSQEQKDIKLKNIIWDEWKKIRNTIPKEKHEHYISEIAKEFKIIQDTKMADYFLLDYEIVKEAVKNGGQITGSGRGSGVSMFVNTLLGFSKIDRISASVTMFPERFMSVSRILESGSLPDLDMNLGNPEVFADTQRKIFGEHNSYPMIAYDEFGKKSSWKMYAKAKDVDFSISNAISQSLAEYETALKYANDDEKDLILIEDYIDDKYMEIFEHSKVYHGIISGAKAHPCFMKGTKILTDTGYKNIEDIKIGDNVFTHNNRFRQVENTMNHKSNDVYSLKCMGRHLKVTGNHPMYVISQYRKPYIQKNGKWSVKREYTNPYWKDASELDKNDKIGFPINQNSIIPHGSLPFENIDFWWIVGRYLGDGWCEDVKNRTEFRLIICCNKKNDETKDIIKKVNGLFDYRILEESTSNKIFIKNKELFIFLKYNFGKYAHGKYIPQLVQDLPEHLLKSFLDGYISADGHITKKEVRFTTASYNLALGLQLAIHKAFKRPCYIGVKKEGTDIIEGRKVNRKKHYLGSFSITETKKDRNIIKDNHAWVQFKHIEKIEGNHTVYNMSVVDDNSYTVDNHIVHNCAWLIYDKDIREEIGLILLVSESTGKRTLACLMDGLSAEQFKFLKNDLLKVDVVKLAYKIAEKIGKPMPTENELIMLCDGNKKVWDIYANGWTVGVNQVEKEGTTKKVMRYKPQNIAELCAFIAGIRPSFQSMYKTFEKREHFEYGIPTFDKIIQDTGLSSSFILYQETIMAVLGFAGFPQDETYDIIKSISKKRKEKINKIKPRFINNFKQRVIENDKMTEDDAVKASEMVWQIIENSAAYGFNSAHSYSYAYDSLLCAYYKANYPLVFYETLMQEYTEKGNKKKVQLLRKEMQDAFGIKIKSIKFGNDNRSFVADFNDNSINVNMSSVKGIGTSVADGFFSIKDNKYSSFTELLKDVYTIGIADRSQIQKLIQLNYFSNFGSLPKLLNVYELFHSNKDIWKKKTAKKDNIPFNEYIIKKYCEKETPKQYCGVDFIKVIKEIELSLPNYEANIKDLIKYQLDLIGNIELIDGEDKRRTVVTEIKETEWNKKLSLYCLATGETKEFKLRKKDYRQDFSIGDILYIKRFEESYKVTPKRDENNEIIRKPNGRPIGYDKTDELELILQSYFVEEEC